MSDMRVRVEVWPVAADKEGLWLLSGTGPWTSGNVPADNEPHGELDYLLMSHGALATSRLVHSTSWRVDGPAVLLTYIAVVDPAGDFAVGAWPRALPVSPVLSAAVGPAQAGPAMAPPVVRQIDVLFHALRHLRFLLDTDVTVRDALDAPWRQQLAAFTPGMAGMYQEPQAVVAWPVADVG